MYKVQYASLNYYPDIRLISNIAVGVIFQVDNNEGYYDNRLNIMQRKSKLFNFDEELDPSFIKIFLAGIKDNFEKFNGKIENFTRFYVNNFKFTSIQSRSFESLSEANQFITDTTRYILHPSQELENKMSEAEKNEYISNYLTNTFDKVKKSFVFKGDKTYDKITVDFMVEDELGIKTGYKIVNKSSQAMFNIRSYIGHALINGENLTFILDDNMIEEKAYILSISSKNSKRKNLNAILKRELVT